MEKKKIVVPSLSTGVNAWATEKRNGMRRIAPPAQGNTGSAVAVADWTRARRRPGDGLNAWATEKKNAKRRIALPAQGNTGSAVARWVQVSPSDSLKHWPTFSMTSGGKRPTTRPTNRRCKVMKCPIP